MKIRTEKYMPSRTRWKEWKRIKCEENSRERKKHTGNKENVDKGKKNVGNKVDKRKKSIDNKEKVQQKNKTERVTEKDGWMERTKCEETK